MLTPSEIASLFYADYQSNYRMSSLVCYAIYMSDWTKEPRLLPYAFPNPRQSPKNSSPFVNVAKAAIMAAAAFSVLHLDIIILN